MLICLYSSATAQTFPVVCTGSNGSVRNIASFDDGISVGVDFIQINGFERINHFKVHESSLNNFTFINNYTQDFNSSGNKESFSFNKQSSTEYVLHIEKALMYIALIQLDFGQIAYQKISILK